MDIISKDNNNNNNNNNYLYSDVRYLFIFNF